MSDPVTAATGPVIVAGVDGSESSKDALRWAAGQAELTGATLRAVMTWHVPMINYAAAMPGSVEADVSRVSQGGPGSGAPGCCRRCPERSR